jgi:hypothetical protein
MEFSFMYVLCNIEVCLCNHYSRKKSNKYYIFWVYVCSLMYPAFQAYVSCYFVIWELVWLYRIFLCYLTTSMIFGTSILNTKCVIFSTNFIHFPLQEAPSKLLSSTYIGLIVKYPLFFSHFNETWIFSADFRKILKYQILWKSVLFVPSCSMQMDGWMDKAKLIVALSNFENVHKTKLQLGYKHLHISIHTMIVAQWIKSQHLNL